MIEDLARPHTFEMTASMLDGNKTVLVFKGTVTVDTEMHIRHGSALIIGGVRWLVADQNVGESLLGRPILEAVVFNTREILTAAVEEHAGVVDVSSLVNATGYYNDNGRVARVLEGI